MKKRLVAIGILLFGLGGCAGGSMIIPGTEVIDSTGKIITKTADTVGDASAYRTGRKYDSWNTAFREYAKAQRDSGFNMSFQMVTIGGTQMYLPSNISFRERPDFHAPAELKDHPVWNTVNTALRTITPWAAGYFITDSIVGGLTTLGEKHSNQYNGPVNMANSQNTAGGDQVYSGPVSMGDGTNNFNSCPVEGEEEVGINDDGTDYDETCTADFLASISGNCSSCASYYAGRCDVKPEGM